MSEDYKERQNDEMSDGVLSSARSVDREQMPEDEQVDYDEALLMDGVEENNDLTYDEVIGSDDGPEVGDLIGVGESFDEPYMSRPRPEDIYLDDRDEPHVGDDIDSDLDSLLGNTTDSVEGDTNETLFKAHAASAYESELDAVVMNDEESSTKADEKSSNADYISESPIVNYQRYLLILRELQKETNEEYFEAFVKRILAQNGTADEDASPEELAKVDIEMAMIRLEDLYETAKPVVHDADEIIGKYDAWSALNEAGYDLGGSSKLPMGFAQDVQVMMAFDDAFPDNDLPPFKDRLKAAKENISQALSSETGKLAMSSIAFSIALGIGSGVALPLAGAMYATKLMENKHVQNLMTSVQDKVGGVLVKLGFKKENVEARKETIGEKMAKITSNKWFKRARLPLAVGMVGLGLASVTSLTDLNVGDAIDSAKEVAANIKAPSMDVLHEIKDAMSDIAANAWERTSSVISGAPGVIGDAKDSVVSIAVEAWESAPQTLSAMPEQAMETTSKVLGSLSNAEIQETGQSLHGALQEYSDAVYDWAFNNDHDLNALAQGEIPQISDVSNLADTANQVQDISQSYYEVQSGDTLWDIAKSHLESTYGDTPTDQQIAAVVQDMNVPDPDHIMPGQMIEIPESLASGASNSVFDSIVADLDMYQIDPQTDSANGDISIESATLGDVSSLAGSEDMSSEKLAASSLTANQSNVEASFGESKPTAESNFADRFRNSPGRPYRSRGGLEL